MIEEQLKRLLPVSKHFYIPYLLDTFIKYRINTPIRIQHFMAQVMHESGTFTYLKEIASGNQYDTRVDLGNTPEIDGDGAKYKGRGAIQITGTTNYKLISKDLGVDFFKNPELLEEPQYYILSAGWFWNKRNLNIFADNDDILRISIRINGVNRKTGLPNGFEDRQLRLKQCKKIIV